MKGLVCGIKYMDTLQSYVDKGLSLKEIMERYCTTETTMRANLKGLEERNKLRASTDTLYTNLNSKTIEQLQITHFIELSKIKDEDKKKELYVWMDAKAKQQPEKTRERKAPVTINELKDKIIEFEGKEEVKKEIKDIIFDNVPDKENTKIETKDNEDGTYTHTIKPDAEGKIIDIEAAQIPVITQGFCESCNTLLQLMCPTCNQPKPSKPKKTKPSTCVYDPIDTRCKTCYTKRDDCK